MGDVPALIVALTGLLAAVAAILQNRRGRAEQRAQQATVDQATSDKGRLEQTQQALDALSDVVRDLRADDVRKDARLEYLERLLDAERDRRRDELATQEDRCRVTVLGLVETVDTLRTVVVDEISRAAAGEHVAAVRPHPHIPPRHQT